MLCSEIQLTHYSPTRHKAILGGEDRPSTRQLEKVYSFRCLEIFTMESLETVLSSYKRITVEPVLMLFCLNLGLTGISTQDLYLQKACRVNLNISRDICDNLQNHRDAQV